MAREGQGSSGRGPADLPVVRRRRGRGRRTGEAQDQPHPRWARSGNRSGTERRTSRAIWLAERFGGGLIGQGQPTPRCATVIVHIRAVLSTGLSGGGVVVCGRSGTAGR